MMLIGPLGVNLCRSVTGTSSWVSIHKGAVTVQVVYRIEKKLDIKTISKDGV